MRVICTYCSANKDRAEGLMPAIDRYRSTRIARVHDLARREGVVFCILSGEYGLVDCDQPIPWYDHLLVLEEVPRLTSMVAQQIVQKNIHQLDYYTPPPAAHPDVSPYTAVVEAACRSGGVKLRILEEPEVKSTMSNWKEIMAMAEDAGNILITDRAQGEQAFERLLMRFPRDGMVFFQRAKAFEAIGEFKLAKADYEVAERLFPMEQYQASARAGSSRMDRKLPTAGTIVEPRRAIEGLRKIDRQVRDDALIAIDKATTDPLGTAVKLRRFLERLASELVAHHAGMATGDLDDNIRALRDHGVVPDIVSSHMNTIRVLGNRAGHWKSGEPSLQPTDVYPSVYALVAILEWFDGNQRQESA
jgi:hypothetical protein